jgi:signal transduction histidine kinase
VTPDGRGSAPRPSRVPDPGSRVRDFFVQNQSIILFAHGLVFFSLGFAIWLQRRRTTRLRLTSSLIWLAAFAFVEGLAVWGYAFVPIQERYMGTGLIDGLIVLRALVQTVAFLFLLQFGLRLVRLSPNVRRGLTAASVALWLGVLLGGAALASHLDWSVKEWAGSVEAVCRYAILLPGGLLSAVGLWRQRDELSAAGMTAIRPYAAAAAAVLAVYALVAGLVVRAQAPWAPGGIGNDDAWFQATRFPLSVVLGLLGLALCVLSVKLLEIFEVEDKQRLEEIDRARAVAEERARFGRDLHDGTIQSLYAAGLHLEAVALRSEEPEVRDEVRKVVAGLDEAIEGLRGYIRALRQPPATAPGIAAGLDELTRRFAEETGLRARLRADGIAQAGPLPDEAGQHLEQILREALSNAARHAGPCVVDVSLCFRADELNLVVVDDGCGLGPDGSVGGQGLRNMRERARRLGGRLAVEPLPGGGTRVALAVPLDAECPDEPEPTAIPSPAHEVSAT